ncbi:ankyrin repeat-containing domain protein [Baffinella frigidus]|nr:ankyrin repeat-containing domain protein [Cryptophyta sp. CCMP2293]
MENLLQAKINVEVISTLKTHTDSHAEIPIGESPLRLAAAHTRKGCAEALLDARADVNGGWPGGGSALHVAARWGNGEVVTLLLARGADVEVLDHDGDSPLRVAAYYNQPESVQLLLAGGARLGARSSAGAMAVHVAAERGKGVAALKMLLEKGVRTDAGVDATIKPDVDSSGEKRLDGRFPLYLAARSGRLDAVYLILQQKRVDKNQSTKIPRRTALHAAALGGHVEVVQALIGARARVALLDKNGNTALSDAVAAMREGDDALLRAKHAQIVKLLIAAGAEDPKAILAASWDGRVDEVGFSRRGRGTGAW